MLKRWRMIFNVPSEIWKNETLDLLKWFSGSSATAGFIKLVQILKMEKCRLDEFEKDMAEGISKEISKARNWRNLG